MFSILKSCPEKFSKNPLKISVLESLFDMQNSMENFLNFQKFEKLENEKYCPEI